MFDSIGIDGHASELSKGESLKDHLVIGSVARALSLQATGVVMSPEDMITMGNQLAAFGEAHSLSPQVIQNALIAAEPSLRHLHEGRPNTY